MSYLCQPLRLHPRKVSNDLERSHEDHSMDYVSLPFPTSLDRTNTEALVVYTLFTNPTRRLDVLCPMEDDDGTPEVFSTFLAQTTSLERLDMYGGFRVSAEETSLRSLCQGFPFNLSITTLSLSKFNFGHSRSAQYLQQMLYGKTNIQRLSFVFCDFGDHISCFSEGLKVQKDLQSLKLACIMDDRETAEIIQAISMTRITDLHLSNCIMESKSMVALNALLKTSTRLEDLSLPGSFFQCQTRVDDFGSTLATSNISLQSLSDSSGRKVDARGTTLILKSLHRNRKARQIREATNSESGPLSPSIIGLLLAESARHDDTYDITFYTLKRGISGNLVGLVHKNKNGGKKRAQKKRCH